MLKPIIDQIKLLLFSILSGVIIGIIYDIYRLMRGIKIHNSIITFLEDTLFWILSAIIVFIFLLYTSYAFIGTYVYLYIAIGILIYFRALSKTIFKLENKLINITAKTFRVVINYGLYPFLLLNEKLNAKKQKKDKK